ncbi:hypothetical protein NBRC116592_20470 [Colwellia sp. KU-HH00111]
MPLKSKIAIVLFTTFTFVCSFFLADYLSDNRLDVTAQYISAKQWLKSILEGDLETNNVTKLPVQITNTFENSTATTLNQHFEYTDQPRCKDTSLGKVNRKKATQVYTWVDKQGISHFSDNPPQIGNFSSLSFAGEKVFDYFSLTLNTQKLAYDFNQKLKVKLYKLFTLYGDLLPLSSLKKVNIDLKVYESKTDFNRIKANHNISLSDNTRGFYNHNDNKAHLLYTSNDDTLRVATHEATHAINRAVIGYTPRWLNEGLAEVSESIEVKAKVGRLFSSKDWTEERLFKVQKISLNTLFSATADDWNGPLTIRLYANSWAFIYFMLEQQQRKAMLAKLIQYEQQNLCDKTSANDIEQIFGMSLSKLQIQFTRWLDRKIKPQQI